MGARSRLTVARRPKTGKWVCKGPQGHVGKGRTRWAAILAYAKRQVAGPQPASEV